VKGLKKAESISALALKEDLLSSSCFSIIFKDATPSACRAI